MTEASESVAPVTAGRGPTLVDLAVPSLDGEVHLDVLVVLLQPAPGGAR